MKTVQHTPGPWTTEHQGGMERKKNNGEGVNRWQCVGLESGKDIAEVFLPSGKWNDAEGQANAQLIAAAPELFEALHVVERTFGHRFNNEIADLVESAIAKAEGRHGTH